MLEWSHLAIYEPKNHGFEQYNGGLGPGVELKPTEAPFFQLKQYSKPKFRTVVRHIIFVLNFVKICKRSTYITRDKFFENFNIKIRPVTHPSTTVLPDTAIASEQLGT